MHARFSTSNSLSFLAALAALSGAACSQAGLERSEPDTGGLAGQPASSATAGASGHDAGDQADDAPGADDADSAAGGGAGGDQSADSPSRGPEPGPQPCAADHTPPSILATKPARGAQGVPADAAIYIKFSEPMDEESTVAAFRSNSLSAAELTFLWNEAHTALAIRPQHDLHYASARLEPGDVLTLAPQSYDYAFAAGARDLAGNALSGDGTEQPLTFSTLRHVTQTLAAVPELSGTLLSAAPQPRLFGFLSFDLGELPAGLSQLLSGVLHPGALDPGAVAPFDLQFVSAHFTALDQSAIEAPATPLALVPQGASLDITLTEDLLAALRAAYDTQSPAWSIAQSRVELPAALVAEGAAAELAEVFTGSALELEYLVP